MFTKYPKFPTRANRCLVTGSVSLEEILYVHWSVIIVVGHVALGTTPAIVFHQSEWSMYRFIIWHGWSPAGLELPHTRTTSHWFASLHTNHKMGSLDNFVCLHCKTQPSPDREPDSEDENIVAISWLLVNAKSTKVCVVITRIISTPRIYI